MTAQPAPCVSRLRWLVLGLVFAATTLNYVDRQIIALLKPTLETELHWRESDYADIVSAFQLATAASFLFAGAFVDRVGLRLGYAVGVTGWSLAAMAHALVRGIGGFVGVRVALAVAETVNTPASVKAVAAWFPEKERSLALGLGNAAPNIGAIATPLIVPALAAALGWRTAFLVTGAAGFVWLAAWLALPRRRFEAGPGGVSAAPASIEAAPAPVPWRRLARDRSTWAVALAKIPTDAVWWFLLFWTPDLLHRRFGLTSTGLSVPVATVFAMAAAGAVFGGVLPTRLLARGRSLNTARKSPMVVAAVLALPLPLLLTAGDVRLAVGLIGLTLFAHQTFSTNIFALATDRFPGRAIGSVVGFGALCGNLAGFGMARLAGYTLEHTGGYAPLLFICAGAYVAALALVQLCLPRISERSAL